ncbi:hypothetical protein RhiirA4_473767 [Rhizophagus irregularis]|uniref:Reverse transcriptase zinc-binding domain-containing protein n=1 Tax=Rhizophagus irregularis TaxID=588596 RepID=A0A2I1H7C4_9GLOM|nr:hypothetical protein RhiirA4_473767 [Rhizophagus irregularis]
MQSSFHSVDWSLSFETFKQSLYPRLAVTKSSIFSQFRLKLWFDELPVMYRLSQRFSGLYADDSLCPTCGAFMETLEHLFICSPDYLDTDDNNPLLPNHKDITTKLIQRFLVKLATKISSSSKCKKTYDELLVALRELPSLGLPELLLDNNYSSFSASWFLRSFIPRDLPTCLMRQSGLSYSFLSSIISRTFLKLQREIYHGLWRPRCKLKVEKDAAKNILPNTLRSYKGPFVQHFHFSAMTGPRIILI